MVAPSDNISPLRVQSRYGSPDLSQSLFRERLRCGAAVLRCARESILIEFCRAGTPLIRAVRIEHPDQVFYSGRLIR